ncbi:hypothetical protein ACFO5K_07270 [Nocardia halotolerans]|uniref:Uncharacterized protein n=1 Tax=Nocardia halotolerans TaxID=1755878 RepID=A0ABV8VF32_9NOCA
MNEIEYVLGIGDPLGQYWPDQALADSADTLWLDFDADTSFDDALLPDIPLAAVDHRVVLAQESQLSRPPWLGEN